jgi:hypothetical protein
VAFNRLGDLGGGENQAAGRVDDEVDRRIWVSEPNGSENFFGIFYIDVPNHRNAENIDGFLTIPGWYRELEAWKLLLELYRSGGVMEEWFKRNTHYSNTPVFLRGRSGFPLRLSAALDGEFQAARAIVVHKHRLPVFDVALEQQPP